jgi:predicted aminopeptidase
MTSITERLRELIEQTDAFANNRHHSFVTTQQMARESAAALTEAADEIDALEANLASRDDALAAKYAEIERLRVMYNDCIKDLREASE